IGVSEALVRHEHSSRDVLNTGFTLNAARGALTALIIAGGAPVVASFFGEPRLTVVLTVLAVGFAAQGLENVGTVQFRREMVFGVQFLLLLLPRLLQLVATVAVALTFRNYWALVAGILTGRLASLLAGYVLHPFRPRFSLAAWREIAGFSIWSWIAALTRLVWNRMDAFIIGSMLGPAKLGSYLVGADLALLPASELIAPVVDVLFPGFAKARSKDPGSLRMVPSVILALSILTFPVAAAVSAGANFVIAVMLGPKWAEAQPVVSVLAWLCIVQPTSYVTWVYLLAIGHIRKDFEVIALASCFKFPVLLLAATTGSILAVSGAILAAGIAEGMLFTWQLRRTAHVADPGSRLCLLRFLAAAGVTVAALYASGHGWQATPAPLLQALASAIALGATACAVLWGALLALWWAAGRPAGPERLLLQNGLAVLAPVLGRFRATRRQA
ncbi:MAG: oligosaccharide flippase family protein, partial [Acetobacteraceae bacterium]|nr:oligosaccharide flippase family protein [Acetobacteraceae bacterium]